MRDATVFSCPLTTQNRFDFISLNISILLIEFLINFFILSIHCGYLKSLAYGL